MIAPGTADQFQPPFADAEITRICAHVETLFGSSAFTAAPRRAQLLRYLIDRTLEGRADEIVEYGIGLDVFGKPPTFDPRTDSAVRSETSRLRQKLKEYYLTEGRGAEVVIDLPPRSYVPRFIFRAREVSGDVTATPPEIFNPRRRNWVLTALAAVAIAASVFAAWKGRPNSNPAFHSLVVLPFSNISTDPQNRYLADGLTEELTNQLAQSPDLKVVARTSAFAFKDKGVDVREVGRKLNVEIVIEGSVDKQGDRIRVIAQMNRASNGYHLWSKSFETQSKDVLILEEELGRSIAEAVRGGRNSAAPTPARSTGDAEAHDLYLKGIYEYSRHTPESYRKARDLCQAAIARDPLYSSPYLCIARAEHGLIHLTVESPDEGSRRMQEAVEKVLEIDPSSGEAHSILGLLAYTRDWDWPRAERESRAALDHGNFHSWFGWALATRGRFPEAEEQFRIADDLDPLNAALRFNQMISFLLERKYVEATQVLRGVLRDSPDQLDTHAFLALIAVYQHDCNAAAPEIEFCARRAHIPAVTFLQAAGCVCRGEQQKARAYLEQMAAARDAFVSPYQLATGYAMLHDEKTALDYLNKAADAHEEQILYLLYDPAFDGVRGNPQFVALEKRVGLL
ncbi:MAG TPA: hypothetical protein VK752_25955 [Bryobacteraceae bacterium]|jgi:adenylate cyclase|nr:hypothetical protein [Bryobacteraceae bacterium]